MRVLFVTYPAVTLLEGGIRTQTINLAQEFARLGHEAVFFDPWQAYDLHSFDWVYCIGAHLGTVHLVRAIRQLGARLAVSPVYFSRRSPSVLGWRTGWIDLWQGATGLVSESHFTREVCCAAEIVLPNTRAEADLLARGLGIAGARIHVVPNGCAARFYSARPDAFVREFGLRDFVLYVGHIGLGRKNLLGLIRAMKEVDRPLVVIGKVLENDYSRQCLSEAQQLRQFRLIPGLPHDSEVFASAMAACEVICLPSLFETPGLAALEAGLAGAKIAITRHGGTVEYFGDYAHYLEPGSLASVRTAIRAALDAPKDGRLREHIRANFLWSHAAKRLETVLLASISSNKAGSGQDTAMGTA